MKRIFKSGLLLFDPRLPIDGQFFEKSDEEKGCAETQTKPNQSEEAKLPFESVETENEEEKSGKKGEKKVKNVFENLFEFHFFHDRS